jgi:uncharacterized protein with PIN domain
MDDITEGKLRQLRNLKTMKGKTDEEIIGMLQTRALQVKTSDKSYDARFNQKLKLLQTEFSIDMNSANDADSLVQLVRHTLQLENIDTQIQSIQQKTEMDIEDTRILKNLTDSQRSIATTLSELQDKLAINRKARKEKSADDIPQYIQMLRKKGKEFFERKTESVKCQKCEIEYARFWLNFPKLTKEIRFEIECWNCHEKIMYAQ